MSTYKITMPNWGGWLARELPCQRECDSQLAFEMVLEPDFTSVSGVRAAVRTAEQEGAPNAKPEKTPAQELFQGQLHPKKMRKISILDQWHEITVEDGKTVTRAYPSNEDLIKRGQKMLPPPMYVYRRMNFVNHVPPEYFWATSDPIRRKNGGMCIQRMTVDTWLTVIAREKLKGDGHIGVTGVGNMPRPKERGGCSCPVCTNNAALFAGV